MSKKNSIFVPPQGEPDKHPYHTHAERKLKELLNPFDTFINSQTSASILLIMAIVVGLVLKNWDLTSHSYDYISHLTLGITIGSFNVSNSLQHWTNEMLLTLFFYFVGLEIKREILTGDLRDKRYLIVILSGALGGMLAPTLIYLGVTHFAQIDLSHGWPIPIATDTAIALGIMSLVKNKLNKGSYAFIAALAIFDDIAAILIIAFVYSEQIVLSSIFIAFMLVILLTAVNLLGFRKPWTYLIIGFLLWSVLQHAGIHGTIAGIIIAVATPTRPEKGPNQIIKQTRKLISKFKKLKDKTPHILEDELQEEILQEVEEHAAKGVTPLKRWETLLSKPVIFFVLPLFAFVNSGIEVHIQDISVVLKTYLFWGVAMGLYIGKPLGILLLVYLCAYFKIGRLPKGISYLEILILGFLCGIGFTISVFISTLSFKDPQFIDIAKLAVIVGSTLSALTGIFLAKVMLNSKKST